MNDTIAAVSTPLGHGALSIVRLSGPDALAICDKCFRGRAGAAKSSHKSVLAGEIVDSDGTPIDQVVVLVMRSPNSYTGEHLVEITCHGGVEAPRAVLGRVLREGARPARPGEFTRRAVLNGKMDLVQAEAVSELIQAGSRNALRVAMRQLKGELSSRISQLESLLLEQLAAIEAGIDFPDDEVEAIDRPALDRAMTDAAAALSTLISSHKRGRMIKQGIDVAIVGSPNVGKSSLFNSLLGRDRVIVSEVAGTTRDVVDAALPLDGIMVNLHDTAGVLVARDRVEAAAAERTRACIEESDAVLVVVDASRALDEADTGLMRQLGAKPSIIVFNKIDLGDVAEQWGDHPEARVSALRGWGMDDLLAELGKATEGMVGDLAEEVITSERHALCLGQALEAVGRGRSALGRRLPLELIASDLRGALSALGEVTGHNANEEVLEQIFSRFCIGK